VSLDQGFGILPWSPLAGGLLSGKFDLESDEKGPEGSRRASFDFPPVDRSRAAACLRALRPVAAAHDTSVARVALAWMLQKPHVTSVIIGAKSEQQLDDNLAATELKLSAEELKALDEASALPPEYPGWMVAFQNRDPRG
jgi:aryl-alcohol dehydrogenase-like predicted oxidoreductase